MPSAGRVASHGALKIEGVRAPSCLDGALQYGPGLLC